MHAKHAFDLETAFVSRGTASLTDCIMHLPREHLCGRAREPHPDGSEGYPLRA